MNTNNNNILLGENQLNRLFPFYILISSDSTIKAVGSTLEKVIQNTANTNFNLHYSIKRPAVDTVDFKSLFLLQNQLVVIECKNANKTNLRGQLELISSNEFLFIGSPWFGSIEQVHSNNLSINDFAFHDPMFDLLHVLKTQEIANDDLKELLAKQQKQKKQLVEANKQIKDIALFPMQNPDPLFRVSDDGDVLMKNPAAEKLTTFKYNNVQYNEVDFWKELVQHIEKDAERFTVEVEIENKTYSLVCKHLKEQNYFNIYGRNVTIQKQNEERLIVLSKIAEENLNPVIISDKDGKITWVNDSFCKITEYTFEEVIGKKPGSLLQGENTDKETIKYISEQLKQGKPFFTELLNYSKTKRQYWLRIQCQPIYNSKNELTGFFALEEDITEIKNAEQKLDSQRRFYENILNSMPADIAVFNTKHEYLFVNPRAIKDDFLRNWIIGKTDEDYCILKNKPLSIAQDRRKIFDNVVSQKKYQEFEQVMIDANNNETTILRRMFPVLNDDNEVTLVIGYGLDITERKKIEDTLKINEEKYRGIISNVNLGLIEVDTEQNVEFANNTLLKMLQIENENIIGRKATSFLAEEGIKTIQEKIQNRKQGVIEAYEILVQVGKEKKWWLVSSAPRIKDKKIIGATIVFLDINERKELEKQLHSARDYAEKLAKTKEEFLANMSHEIRTPMNAIIGMGNQLNKTDLNDKQQFYLKTINTAAENLLIILNDILDLSKIEAGKLSLEKIAFEPKEVLARAMSVMMHKAEEKGIAFTNSFCDQRLSNVLIGDPFRLNQVLLNLVSNAIKFTEKGSVNIDCEVLNQDSKKQHIRITVSDTGIGMSETFSKNLFQKFTQEDESTTRKYGGTGLGMSICRELVELMNGKIYAESSKGVGSKFFVEIVLEKGSSDQLSSSSKIENLDIKISDSKILLADDNEMNRLVATTILNNYGCKIDEAQNGVEVLEKLKDNHYDVILMDIQMPLLDGIEATKKIRQSNINIPIIALTAFALKGDEEKFLSVGMNDYLVKPFKENDLLNIISKWLLQNKKSPSKVINTLNDITTTTPQNAKLYSLDTLKEISRGNEDFVKKMTTLFCDQTEIAVTEIKEHFANNELVKVSSLAHKIKPSLDNLKIDSLKTVIREIEKDAKENINNESIKKKIDILDEVISKVILELRNS
ncbi:MAG: PAS domain S-box protein [Chitinophagaceae bacterium]